jgi:hypothetical protein
MHNMLYIHLYWRLPENDDGLLLKHAGAEIYV